MATLIEKARNWTPNPNDPYGRDKKIFLNYLLRNCAGFKNSQKIDSILESLSSRFNKIYKRGSLQHLLLVPLREEAGFFVGTSSKGIYFVEGPEDALITENFYSKRIRSEEKHLRNLQIIVSKNRLFRDYTGGDKLGKPVNVYFDESGRPDLGSGRSDPYFIVTGVVMDVRDPYNLLKEKLIVLRKQFGKPVDYEFKSSKLSSKEHLIIIKELRSIDYEFLSVCFVKDRLDKNKFGYPPSFYKYANRFLVEKLLNRLGKVNLFFDQYGDPSSPFEKEFTKYIRSKSDTWPKDKINQINMIDSKTSQFIQTADLITGAVSKSLRRKGNFLPYLMDKKIELCWFPYQ